jgi:hypothetical protein
MNGVVIESQRAELQLDPARQLLVPNVRER